MINPYLGRIGTDLILKKSEKDKSYLLFNLAVSDEWNIKKANWLPCVAYGKIAINIEKFFEKGNQILVMAEAKSSQNKKTKQTTIQFAISKFYFVGDRKKVETEDKEDKKEETLGHFVSADDIDVDLPF